MSGLEERIENGHDTVRGGSPDGRNGGDGRLFTWFIHRATWFLLTGLLTLGAFAAPRSTRDPGFELLGSIPVGEAPHGIRFSQDGKLAFVACAGEGTVTVIDCDRLRVLKKLNAGETPLGLVARAGGDEWVVTQFRGTQLISIKSNGGQLGQTWRVGRGPSLFASRVIHGLAYLVSELADELIVFDTRAGKIRARYPTGKRPYPAAVTRDGVLAFVPNRTDGTVSVIDLLNEETVTTTAVGLHPEGGALTGDDVSYIVACGGSNELDYLNTASFKVVARVAEGVGPRPFSVAITNDGRFGVVNNAGGDTVSILDVQRRQIIGQVKVGKQPIVVRMHPDGWRVFVSSEGSNTVSVLRIPPAAAKRSKGRLNEVLVLGMIHGEHRTSKRYSLALLKKLIRAIKPDFICTEIPPNRFEAAMKGFQATGKVTEPRVSVFPEYVDVVFPLTKEMGFEIIPTAGWNSYMASYRRAKLKQISEDPSRASEWKEYTEAFDRMEAAIKAGGAEDDPRWINTDAYDQAIRIGFETYNRLFNDELGTGGWDSINAAHYANIAKALDEHSGEGKRFLITYGAAHKSWFMKKLRKRRDIKLLDVQRFLDQVERETNKSQ